MADVIEGFLVSLGFEVDEDARARFNANVQDAAKRMKTFGVSVAGAATALAASWATATNSLRDSFNLASTTGASVRGIEALRLAIRAVGGDAGALDSTLVEMSARLQTMPGYADQLRAVFGVSLTDSTGRARDMADVLADIGVKLRGMDSASAAAAAQATGLGAVWQQLIDKRFAKALDDARGATSALGADIDRTAQSSAELANSFDLAFSTIRLSFQAFVSEINNKFNLANTITEWAKQIPNAVQNLTKEFIAVVNSEIRIWKESTSFGDWALKWLGIRDVDAIHQDERKKQGLVPNEDVINRLDASARKEESLSGAYGAIDEDPEADNYRQSAYTPPKVATPGPTSLPSIHTRGMESRNPGNLREVGGGNFLTFATFEEGYRAMATQLKMYQNAGAENIRDIISTYAPKSENNTEAYIKAVTQFLSKELGTKITAQTALDLSSPRILSALTRGMIRQENGAGAERYFEGASFEREAAIASQAKAKSRAFNPAMKTASENRVTISQNIYVTGQGAAERIASETENTIARYSQVRDSGRNQV